MSITIAKSPRAPFLSLDVALEKALDVYERESRHAVSLDVIAQSAGYKDANSGTAKGALAALKAFDLVFAPSPGVLAISKEVEDYKFSPDDAQKQSLLLTWVRAPKIYALLLDKFPGKLPSKSALRYELIQQGFRQQAVDGVLNNFIRSVEFAKVYSHPQAHPHTSSHAPYAPSEIIADTVETRGFDVSINTPSAAPSPNMSEDSDKIPVRLSGGRRAWLEIPVPFYEKDKELIRKQVDLIIVDDENDSN